MGDEKTNEKGGTAASLAAAGYVAQTTLGLHLCCLREPLDMLTLNRHGIRLQWRLLRVEGDRCIYHSRSKRIAT